MQKLKDQRLEQRIEQSHKEWMAAIDAVDDAIFIHDKDFRILRCNLAYKNYAGVKFKEIIGQRYYDIFPKSDIPHSHESFYKPSEESLDEELQIGNITFRSRVYTITDDDKNYLYSVHTLENITQHKKMQQKVLDENLFSESLIESMPDIFFLFDQDGKMLRWNKKLKILYGLTTEEMLGVDVLSFIDKADRAHISQKIKEVFQVGSASAEAKMHLTNGQRDYLLTGNRLQTNSGEVNVIGIGIDITERKEAELLLKQERDFSNRLIKTAPVIILTLDREAKIVSFNNYMESLSGYSLEEVKEKDWFSTFLPEEQREKTKELFLSAIDNMKTNGTVNPIITKSGELRLIEWYNKTLLDTHGEAAGLISIGLNITERKESENSLNRANRALKTLSAGNMALVHATNENELLQSVTDIIVKKGGYDLAMVCYAENDAYKSITPKAWSGTEGSYFWKGDPSWADNENGQFPISQAIRNAKTQICHGECKHKAWRDAVQARGFKANIALPLMDKKSAFGTLTLYSTRVEPFDTAEIELLEELAGDLAYGIINQRTRKSHEEHTVVLKESLVQSIQAIAATLESRDPYTAGHQRRVSELSVAIAQEMNLPDDQIEGVRFAAIIHDLGKIHVPAEILSKPGKLNPIEYQLIQMHPQSGYDIIKNVTFPWPIADIILQHHEKLDGSGYPQGLKGEDILLEAKIIAVADVVEAISSHRPYRSALGIEFALEEIQRGRAITYEAAVVDACVNLFTEKDFAFSSE